MPPYAVFGLLIFAMPMPPRICVAREDAAMIYACRERLRYEHAEWQIRQMLRRLHSFSLYLPPAHAAPVDAIIIFIAWLLAAAADDDAILRFLR